VVKLLLRKSEEYLQQRQQLLNASTIEDITAKGTATINLCWCSIFWLMLLLVMLAVVRFRFVTQQYCCVTER
jgi:hypothetical protein